MIRKFPIPEESTPVGFEPTRGDPIGLAGRHLNRSAKVSLWHHPDVLNLSVVSKALSRPRLHQPRPGLALGHSSDTNSRATIVWTAADQPILTPPPAQYSSLRGDAVYFRFGPSHTKSTRQILKDQSGHPESNQGPSDCCSTLQSDALPTEL